MGESVRVTVYSREVCPLCDEAIATIESVAARADAEVAVEEVDVDDDPELRAEYGDRVPYVFVDGVPKFKYRVDPDELADLL